MADGPLIPGNLLIALAEASRVVVMTGAGVSAESGVATFRDPQKGLWSKYRPEQLATAQAFENDPVTVWQWYQWRREQLHQVAPNPGHHSLAEMELMFADFQLITQNVDGLHQKAGSSKVIELHGNIHRNQCSITNKQIGADTIDTTELQPIRSPYHKDGWARPAVVWFGESLPENKLSIAFNTSANADVFFSVGTSSLVEPAASMARLAKSNGAVIVEINPQTTPLSAVADWCLNGNSGDWLPKIVQSLQEINARSDTP